MTRPVEVPPAIRMVTIKTRGGDSKVVPALFEHGGLAVTPSLQTPAHWNITHVATGGSADLIAEFCDVMVACRVLLRLVEIHDWSPTTVEALKPGLTLELGARVVEIRAAEERKPAVLQ
jgi:hypothetical protein